MSKKLGKLVTVCAVVVLVVAVSGTAQANWSETFDASAFDLTTWLFRSYPELTGTFSATIQDGPGDDDYLSIDETNSAAVGGSQFGVAIGDPDDIFSDVRVGAVVNVTGGLRNYHGMGARTTYIIDDGSASGYPGIIASSYVMLIHWQDGPANLRIEVFKIVNNLSDIMDKYHEEPVPGLGHARSYYAELDVVGSDPVYITGSLYEYKGGPLMARTPTFIDTSANDPWEKEGFHDAVFPNGVSAIFGMNQDPEPPGYHATFDTVSSISDGPAAVNPSPADGATDAAITADLIWVEAAFATSRDLWFGKKGAMQKIDAAPGVTYDPGTLEFGETYEWRVDEIGPASTVTGHTWSFTTAEYLSVDDFESYSDDAGIESKWPHNVPPTPFAPYHYVFLETGRVSQGSKSMRLEYENQYEPFLTEAALTFDSPQDWTIAGVKDLLLSFRGENDNVEQPMFIRLEDSAANTSTVVHPFTYAVQSEFWRSWEIALEEFSNGGVNLAAITKIAIGIGNGTDSGQQLEDRDIVYIDHIRLCP